MSLFSPHWFRVATLRPRLAPQVRVQRQVVRGASWHVLSKGLEAGHGAHAASGAACRLNAAAYALAGRFDGRHSLQSLWDGLQARGDEQAPTQDEAIAVLLKLHESGLVAFDTPVDFGALHARDSHDSHDSRGAAPTSAEPAKRFNPLAWRIPLHDPSRWLPRLGGLARLLFSPIGALLWLLAVAALLAGALLQGPALLAHAGEWMATPRYLLLAALLYPPIKLLHELGHALAVQRFGGTVREAGITLMAGLPVPYVDASAASALRSARQRAVVSAAGIMVELAVAALGLLGFMQLDDGWLRDAAFVAFFIGSVSTLVFNANPLQRFDGYYLLTDLLGLPNLGPRSRAFWLEQLRAQVQSRQAAGQEDAAMPLARGEAPWLWLYAPLSWLWQLGVAVGLTLWLGHAYAPLGVAAGLWLGWRTLLVPPMRLLRELLRTALAAGTPPRRLAGLAAALGLPLLLLLALPLPDRLLVQGVVWAPDEALVRTATAGFVETVAVADGTPVEPGALLLTLRNPALRAQRDALAARLAAAEHEQYAVLGTDADTSHALRAGNAAEDVERLQAELTRLDERLAGLEVRAHAAGRLVLPRAGDLPGSWVRQGTLVGHVVGPDKTRPTPATTLRVALPESQAALVRERLRGVQARLSDNAGTARTGRLVRDAVGATLELPSPALAERHGGDVLTEPAPPAAATRPHETPRALRAVVPLDIALDTAPGATPAEARPRLGQRAWVRFDLGWTPPALQLLRWARARLVQAFDDPGSSH